MIVSKQLSYSYFTSTGTASLALAFSQGFVRQEHLRRAKLPGWDTKAIIIPKLDRTSDREGQKIPGIGIRTNANRVTLTARPKSCEHSSCSGPVQGSCTTMRLSSELSSETLCRFYRGNIIFSYFQLIFRFPLIHYSIFQDLQTFHNFMDPLAIYVMGEMWRS